MKSRDYSRTFFVALCALTLAAFITTAQAETVTMNLALSPSNEVPPVTGLTATGNFQLTLEITRDATGAIVSGKVSVLGGVNFPGAITITGFHIHSGASTANGPIIFDSGITTDNPLMIALGAGVITSRELSSTNAELTITRLTNLRNSPTGFYLNLHTTANTSGAIRSQLTRWDELRGNTVTMSPAQEVPPVTGLSATATAAIVLNAPRFMTASPTSGNTIAFNIAYEGFPANTTFTGLHIHEGVAGANGGVVFDTGISPANPLISPTGKGTINIPVTIGLTSGDAARRAALARMLGNPAGFYVNLHTTANPSGALRAQLTDFSGPRHCSSQ
ncbi:MAG TPA: CHRD domain-containing protein [Blastocatellia bacterium]|nr:CHRD domain-containing protein [Blastocatellia bacterium]